MAWIEGSRLTSRSLSRSRAARFRSFGLFLVRPAEEMAGPRNRFARYLEDHWKGRLKAWQIRAMT